MTGTKVLEVQADRLITSAGEVPADLIVWAAGIKAAEANATYGLEINRANQFVVSPRLETSSPGLFALGDCSSCPWENGRQVPARAQAAHQQASYLVPVPDGLAGRAPARAALRLQGPGLAGVAGRQQGVWAT